MIVLIQIQEKADKWGDINIPRRTTGVPVRGEKPFVTTVDEFVEELKSAGMVGVYRIFMATGEIWRIMITQRDTYDAEIRRELPEV